MAMSGRNSTAASRLTPTRESKVSATQLQSTRSRQAVATSKTGTRSNRSNSATLDIDDQEYETPTRVQYDEIISASVAPGMHMSTARDSEHKTADDNSPQSYSKLASNADFNVRWKWYFECLLETERREHGQSRKYEFLKLAEPLMNLAVFLSHNPNEYECALKNAFNEDSTAGLPTGALPWPNPDKFQTEKARSLGRAVVQELAAFDEDGVTSYAAARSVASHGAKSDASAAGSAFVNRLLRWPSPVTYVRILAQQEAGPDADGVVSVPPTAKENVSIPSDDPDAPQQLRVNTKLGPIVKFGGEQPAMTGDDDKDSTWTAKASAVVATSDLAQKTGDGVKAKTIDVTPEQAEISGTAMTEDTPGFCGSLVRQVACGSHASLFLMDTGAVFETRSGTHAERWQQRMLECPIEDMRVVVERESEGKKKKKKKKKPGTGEDLVERKLGPYKQRQLQKFRDGDPSSGFVWDLANKALWYIEDKAAVQVRVAQDKIKTSNGEGDGVEGVSEEGGDGDSDGDGDGDEGGKAKDKKVLRNGKPDYAYDVTPFMRLERVMFGIASEARTTILQVACGHRHFLAISDAETENLFAWGSNTFGQVGAGGMGGYYDAPVPIIPKLDKNRQKEYEAGLSFVFVAGGARHSMAVDCNGGLWGWGSNEHGQLGLPSSRRRNSKPDSPTYTYCPVPTLIASFSGRKHAKFITGFYQETSLKTAEGALKNLVQNKLSWLDDSIETPGGRNAKKRKKSRKKSSRKGSNRNPAGMSMEEWMADDSNPDAQLPAERRNDTNETGDHAYKNVLKELKDIKALLRGDDESKPFRIRTAPPSAKYITHRSLMISCGAQHSMRWFSSNDSYGTMCSRCRQFSSDMHCAQTQISTLSQTVTRLKQNLWTLNRGQPMPNTTSSPTPLHTTPPRPPHTPRQPLTHRTGSDRATHAHSNSYGRGQRSPHSRAHRRDGGGGGGGGDGDGDGGVMARKVNARDAQLMAKTLEELIVSLHAQQQQTEDKRRACEAQMAQLEQKVHVAKAKIMEQEVRIANVKQSFGPTGVTWRQLYRNQQVRVILNQDGKKAFPGRVLGIHSTTDPSSRHPLPVDQWQYRVHLDHEEQPGIFPRIQIMVQSTEVERTVATMAMQVQTRNQELRDQLQESYSLKQAEMEKLLQELRSTSRYIGASRYCRRLIMDTSANL